LQNFDEALRDFKAVLEVDPDNKAAKNQLVMTTHKIKQIHNREKQMYAGMFQKFAEIDAKVNVCRVSYVFTYDTISYTVLSLFSLRLTNLFNVISSLQQYCLAACLFSNPPSGCRLHVAPLQLSDCLVPVPLLMVPTSF